MKFEITKNEIALLLSCKERMKALRKEISREELDALVDAVAELVSCNIEFRRDDINGSEVVIMVNNDKKGSVIPSKDFEGVYDFFLYEEVK